MTVERKKKETNKVPLLSVQLSTFVLHDSHTHMWKTVVLVGGPQVCRTVVPGGVAQRLSPDSLA